MVFLRQGTCGGGQYCRIDNGSFFNHQPFGFQLLINQLKDTLIQIVSGQDFFESPKRAEIRNLLIQVNPNKSLKTQPVNQRSEERRVGKECRSRWGAMRWTRRGAR